MLWLGMFSLRQAHTISHPFHLSSIHLATSQGFFPFKKIVPFGAATTSAMASTTLNTIEMHIRNFSNEFSIKCWNALDTRMRYASHTWYRLPSNLLLEIIRMHPSLAGTFISAHSVDSRQPRNMSNLYMMQCSTLTHTHTPCKLKTKVCAFRIEHMSLFISTRGNFLRFPFSTVLFQFSVLFPFAQAIRVWMQRMHALALAASRMLGNNNELEIALKYFSFVRFCYIYFGSDLRYNS